MVPISRNILHVVNHLQIRWQRCNEETLWMQITIQCISVHYSCSVILFSKDWFRVTFTFDLKFYILIQSLAIHFYEWMLGWMVLYCEIVTPEMWHHAQRSSTAAWTICIDSPVTKALSGHTIYSLTFLSLSCYQLLLLPWYFSKFDDPISLTIWILAEENVICMIIVWNIMSQDFISEHLFQIKHDLADTLLLWQTVELEMECMKWQW